MCSAAELFAHFMRNRADIASCGHGHNEFRSISCKSGDFELENANAGGLEDDGLSLASRLIRRLAVYFLCGKDGRSLLHLTLKVLGNVSHLVQRELNFTRL